MSKCKIGITEAGDAALDLSWVNKLDEVQGTIVITKSVSSDFIDTVIKNQTKLIVHATCTGYGGTILEPNVPTVEESLKAILSLVEKGFPKKKIVIRVDPIIPTQKGIRTARDTISLFLSSGFTRFRISLIDMYPHVYRRFIENGIPSPYEKSSFTPSKKQIAAVDKMVSDVYKQYLWMPDLAIESCAEPGLENTVHLGCISYYDFQLLGLDPSLADETGYQRKDCLCYSGKTELLNHKSRCKHNCLYCYWR